MKPLILFHSTTDVAIQTNSSDKAKIYLRAGQKVIVLKSPKGVCLQLQSGKIIAIRSTQKPGVPNLAALVPKPGGLLPPPSQDGDVIDISNDDDDLSTDDTDPTKKDEADALLSKAFETPASTDNGIPKATDAPKTDNMYKENRYKPNLLPRKPKVLSTSPSGVPPVSQPMQNSLHKSSRWESTSASNYPSSPGSTYRNGNMNSSSQYRSENCELLNHFKLELMSNI